MPAMKGMYTSFHIPHLFISKFVLMFDRFFDVLNVTNFNNWVRTRKPFQRPYNSGNDERLTVCYMYIMYIII